MLETNSLNPSAPSAFSAVKVFATFASLASFAVAFPRHTLNVIPVIDIPNSLADDVRKSCPRGTPCGPILLLLNLELSGSYRPERKSIHHPLCLPLRAWAPTLRSH